MTRRFGRMTATLLLAGLSACMSYQALADPAAELHRYPSLVGPAHVTLRNGERLKFDSLQVDGDSLRGFLKGGVPRSVALASVEAVELRMQDDEKTAQLTDAIFCAVISTFGGESSDCTSGDEE